MLITIDGAKGSGKTYLMAKFQAKDSATMPVIANYDIFVDDAKRFNELRQIYGYTQSSIGIDEGQKLFDARRFMSFPPQFAEMVAGDRHDGNKIYITTQGFDHIDKRVRANTDVLISVNRVFRIPFAQNVPAIIQLSQYRMFVKRIDDKGRVRFKKIDKKYFLISKFFKKLYETYEKISNDDYVIKIKWKKKNPTILLIRRELLESGKKRL